MAAKAGCPSTFAAVVLVVINVVVLLVCLTLLAFGIWAIASPTSLSYAISSLPYAVLKALLPPQVVTARLGAGVVAMASVVGCVAGMGLRGAVNKSQFLLFMYASLILLFLLLECALFYYFSTSLLEKGLQDQDGQWTHALRLVLTCCEHNSSSPAEVSVPWSCCGVEGYPDNCTLQFVYTAHCFWSRTDSKVLPAKNYAVAVGKLSSLWDDPNDDAQKADVMSLHIPLRFRGSASNFMEDLAVMLLTVSFVYKPHIAPVCLDFDENFDHLQLAEGTVGKVAGWGLTDINGTLPHVLKVVELPIVSYDVCFNESPPTFRAFITGDKICAGYRKNGTAVCKGDSGGGLVIAQYERGKYRYYLRGVVSTAPNDENLCNANAISTFTHLFKHAPFIKNYL